MRACYRQAEAAAQRDRFERRPSSLRDASGARIAGDGVFVQAGCSIVDAPKKGELLFVCNGVWKRRRGQRQYFYNGYKATHALETEDFILIPPVRTFANEFSCSDAAWADVVERPSSPPT